ncbi:MAG: CoA-binding protein, partial [Candidatus Nitrosotenuis sp.]
ALPIFLDGIAVQPMMKGGREVIVGATTDPQFGPMVMFGLGGIYVEAIKDVSFRLAPLSLFDAKSMIAEIKSVALLKGMRGELPSDIDSIVDVILRVSCLMADFPVIRELDLNPVMVFGAGEGCVALDARISLEQKK